MRTEIRNIDGLFWETVAQAETLGIPISKKIDKNIRINFRAKMRLGCCRKEPGGRYIIELSARLFNASEKAIKEILSHEILHTCPGCSNHGPLWKQYAEKMNAVYGYTIRRTVDLEKLGLSREAEGQSVKYKVVCSACGMEFKRSRMSNLIKHPAHYRCKCGGTLKRIQ